MPRAIRSVMSIIKACFNLQVFSWSNGMYWDPQGMDEDPMGIAKWYEEETGVN